MGVNIEQSDAGYLGPFPKSGSAGGMWQFQNCEGKTSTKIAESSVLY